ncbi:4-amino-4-deoxy-L-arabinose transferase [Paludisphaera sp.]|uniref:4-amino-4-deoxy-L-arabinose transferase n=1 Tax=Paludisphaera sp. TaxID=2017432 RepID=UPI00301E1577
MPPQRPAPSARFTPPSRVRAAAFGLLGTVALVAFGLRIGDVAFVDEYAYISQSYYADLFLTGEWNDPAWLDFPGYDLMPLPKYLIGTALRVSNEPRPGPAAARMWYANTHSTFGTPRTLTSARVPSILVGGLGCLALAAIGAMAFDFRVGIAAGVLLMLNPLYALHAHRAMSEAPCEAFLMASLALALAAWRRSFAGRASGFRILGLLAGAGVAAALAVLAKFNGLLALMTIAAWAGLAWAIPRGAGWGWLWFATGSALAAVTAGLAFMALNPYMTARDPVYRVADPADAGPLRPGPLGAWGRFRLLIDHRRAMSAGQQRIFPHNALKRLPERAKVVAVQGFGRFGPFGPATSDSTIRYDMRQDRGAFAWLPLCLGAMGYAMAYGRMQSRRREPPAAWAVAAWALVSLTVVTLYLPMAWDRYLLPIQAPFSLLAAAAIVGAWDALARLAGWKPRLEPS